MERAKILQDLQTIFRDVMDNDAIKLTEATSAADVEEWDSLSHLQLVFKIEKFYKIKFATSEFAGWKNVGDLINSIDAKVAK